MVTRKGLVSQIFKLGLISGKLELAGGILESFFASKLKLLDGKFELIGGKLEIQMKTYIPMLAGVRRSI